MAATEKVAQSGEAQITSGLPNSDKICSAVNLEISAYKSISGNDLSQSTLNVWCPLVTNAFSMLRVPENKTRIFITTAPFENYPLDTGDLRALSL
jgi:hypothetical protein